MVKFCFTNLSTAAKTRLDKDFCIRLNSVFMVAMNQLIRRKYYERQKHQTREEMVLNALRQFVK